MWNWIYHNLVFGDIKTTKTKSINNFMTIDKAIETITEQMDVSEFRKELFEITTFT